MHLRMMFQCRIETNKMQARVTQGIMRIECLAMRIDGSMCIPGKKMRQASAVVVMPVRKDRPIHSVQVNPQTRGILDKEVALPHVKQDLLSIASLDMKTQTVLYRESEATGVLHQNGNAHIGVFYVKNPHNSFMLSHGLVFENSII